MAITVIKTNQNLASSTIVKDTNANGTLVPNATSADGSLYSIEVANPNTDWVYFKLADVLTGSAGSTAPVVVFAATASATSSVLYPDGITFQNGFSHWCTISPSGSVVTDPTSQVVVTYVTL